MKRFELLGTSLSKIKMKKIGGGNKSEVGDETCYTKCPSTGKMWGLHCNGDCSIMEDFPGAIKCEGRLYTWGCEGTNQW